MSATGCDLLTCPPEPVAQPERSMTGPRAFAAVYGLDYKSTRIHRQSGARLGLQCEHIPWPIPYSGTTQTPMQFWNATRRSTQKPCMDGSLICCLHALRQFSTFARVAAVMPHGWHHWGMTLLRLNPRRNCGSGRRPFMRTVRSVGYRTPSQVFDTSSGLGCASISSS